MERIVVVGPANVGKSTLINSLTGSKLKVGNWHGVTTSAKEEYFRENGKSFSLTDLPGLYALNSPLAEEDVSKNIILKKDYDLILLVIDANHFKRGLSLLKQLSLLNKPTVCFVNFYSEFYKKGGRADKIELEKDTGIGFFFGDADEKKSAEEFKRFLVKFVAAPTKGVSDFSEEELYKKAYTAKRRKKRENILLKNSFTVCLSFVIFVALSVYLAFGSYGVGNIISEAISRLFAVFSAFTSTLLGKFCSPFVTDLVSEGIISGVGAVAGFLPQIAIMSLMGELAEQSGYTSALAVAADRLLSAFGLNGKAVYSLLGGFGCTAVAVGSVNGIEDKNVKKRAVLSLPFTSCSAKTPVYAFFARYCYPEYSAVLIFSIYLLSVIFTFLHSFLVYKLILKTPPSPLIAEVADMRFPKVKRLIKSVLSSAKNFAVRLGTIIVLCSAFLFLLSKVSVDFSYLPYGGENSLISYIGRAISPLFRPIGISDWRYSVAVLSGIFAKEGIISALVTLFPSGLNIDFAQGMALIVFIYAYTPCIAALSSTAKYVGKKTALTVAVWQFAAATALCYLSYFVAMAVFM